MLCIDILTLEFKWSKRLNFGWTELTVTNKTACRHLNIDPQVVSAVDR